MKLSPKMKAVLYRFGRIVAFTVLAQLATLQLDITKPEELCVLVGNSVLAGIIAGIDKFVRTK